MRRAHHEGYREMIKLIRKLFGFKARADDEADRNAFRDWLREEEGEWCRQREAEGYRLMYAPGTDYYGNHETVLIWRIQWDKPRAVSSEVIAHHEAMNVHGLYWKPVPSEPQNRLAC